MERNTGFLSSIFGFLATFKDMLDRGDIARIDEPKAEDLSQEEREATIAGFELPSCEER